MVLNTACIRSIDLTRFLGEIKLENVMGWLLSVFENDILFRQKFHIFLEIIYQ